MQTQGLEREVRMMLRHARRPSALADIPLVRSLCRVLSEPNATIAMRRAVDGAFAGGGALHARLWDLIVRADLEGEYTIRGAAGELHVSQRQLQRYRAEAIALIAAHARRLLGVIHDDNAGDASPENRLSVLAHLVVEREPLALAAAEERRFRQGREGGSLDTMRAAARALQGLAASEPELKLRAILLESESDIRASGATHGLALAGRLSSENRDVRSYALATYLQAQLAFIDGEFALADDLATAAAAALAPFPEEALDAMMLAGHARLPLLRTCEWTAVSTGWRAASFFSLDARHALVRGCWRDAESLARRALDAADAGDYTGVSAHVRATLGACAASEGDMARAQSYFADALAMYARTRDRVVGSDLFAFPAVPRERFGPFANAVVPSGIACAALKIMFPYLDRNTPDEDTMMQRFIEALVSGESVIPADMQSPFADCSVRFGAELEGALIAILGAPLAHHERSTFARRVRHRISMLASATDPTTFQSYIIR